MLKTFLQMMTNYLLKVSSFSSLWYYFYSIQARGELHLTPFDFSKWQLVFLVNMDRTQHLSGLNAKPNKVSRGNYQLSFEPNLGIFSTNQSRKRPMWYFPLLWLAVVITVNLILRHSWKVLWNLFEVLVYLVIWFSEI